MGYLCESSFVGEKLPPAVERDGVLKDNLRVWNNVQRITIRIICLIDSPGVSISSLLELQLLNMRTMESLQFHGIGRCFRSLNHVILVSLYAFAVDHTLLSCFPAFALFSFSRFSPCLYFREQLWVTHTRIRLMLADAPHSMNGSS